LIYSKPFIPTHSASLAQTDGLTGFLIKSGVCQDFVVAPDLFLTPMDWLLHCTDHCSFLGTTIGSEPFTNLDFADDVALLTKMLSDLLLAWNSTGQRPRSKVAY